MVKYSYGTTPGYEWRNRRNFRRRRKTGRLSIEATSAGKLFQTVGPDTGNALAPTVERRTGRTMKRCDDADLRDDRPGTAAGGPR